MKTASGFLPLFALAFILPAAADGGSGAPEIEWTDGKCLPIEGRAFDLTRNYYDRLPAEAEGRVTGEVWYLQSHTSGFLFRLRTDSPKVWIEWDLIGRDALATGYQPSVGKSGFDFYQRGKDGRLRFRKSFPPSAQTGNRGEVDNAPGQECVINFPLYNGVKSCRIGVVKGSKLESVPQTSKPIVFYGVSTTQGAVASRPGMSFPAIIGRRLGRPVVNLGFAGAGKMEMEMCDYVSRIDASLYVLDTPGNMSLELMKERYEKFVRELHRRRPDVPIVLSGERIYSSDGEPAVKSKFVAELVAKLESEKDAGWKLAHVRSEDMFPKEVDETSVDSPDGHPGDLGMMELADAFQAKIAPLLK